MHTVYQKDVDEAILGADFLMYEEKKRGSVVWCSPYSVKRVAILLTEKMVKIQKRIHELEQ